MLDRRKRSAPSRSGPLCSLLIAFVASGSVAGAISLDDARSLHVAGKLDEALRAYDEVAVTVEATDPASAASARNNSCVIYMNRGDFRRAVEQCREALRLRQSVDDPRRLGRTLNNLGLALQYLGEYREAAEHFGQALAINEALDDVESQVINHANLGVLATQVGRYADALAAHGQALVLAEQSPEAPWSPAQIRVARVNQAVVLERLGAYREAMEIYQTVLEQSREMDPHRRATLMVNLGVVHRNLGDPIRAIDAFERAGRLFDELDDRASRANTLLNIGLAYHLNLGRQEDAETAFRSALELTRVSGDRAEEIRVLYHLGQLLLELGRVLEAGEVFEDANIAAQESDSSEGAWQAEAGLGRVAAARGDLQQAITRFGSAIETIESVRRGLEEETHRSEWFREKRSVYDSAVAALARLEREEAGMGHAERALELVQRAKARALLESLGGTTSKGDPLGADEIASRVGRGLLVEYFVAERSLLAWIVHDGRIRLTELGPVQPLIDAVARVHDELSEGREPGDADLRLLSRALVGQADLPTRFESMRVCPDGKLWYLPFEILYPADDSNTRLIDRTTVSYLPSASTLGSLTARDPIDGLVAAGVGAPKIREAGPGYVTAAELLAARFELGELPGALEELATLRDLMPDPVELHSGVDATEEAVSALLRRGTAVLHLATHTVVDDGRRGGTAILLSRAETSDGLLFPSEIAAMDGRLDLAVLSACRSALGPGEGSGALVSLTGAFLAAGAAGVVATLWDVDDSATRVFMEQFYEQLAAGRAPADALRRAKLRFAADPRWSRSSLWSAYVLVGEGEPVVATTDARVWYLGVAIVLAISIALLMARRSRSARSRRR